MSATSEELPAQSEQLYSSIAYFQLDAGHARAPGRAADDDHNMPVGERPRRRLTRLPQIFQPTARARPTLSKNTAAPCGFALDVADDDHHDADFVKY